MLTAISCLKPVNTIISQKHAFLSNSDTLVPFFEQFSDIQNVIKILGVYQPIYRLRWSRSSVLVFSTQVRGFKPDRSSQIFRAKKILSTPSFGGEVKPSVPCRRFAACKRSLNLRGSRNLGQISRPQFHLSLLGSLASLRPYRHLAAKVGTSKGGGKQWKTTPKNLPRMQCARAILVT